MRVIVEAEEGVLASSPGEALATLAHLAHVDGADLDDWLEKAISSAGATKLAVSVSREPRFRIVEDAIAEADEVYKRAMTMAASEIRELLNQALSTVDYDKYRRVAR